MTDIKAVVFDMDGVLIDTEPVNQGHIRQFFRERGLDLPVSATSDLIGCSGSYFVARIDEWWAQTPAKPDDERDLGASEAMDRYFEGLTYDYPSLLNEGVAETLTALRKAGIRTAVASSTTRKGIEEALGACGVLDLFAFVLSGEDFARGKPHPDVYLAALARLGVSPDACIAVEDSDRGIEAARRAGLRVAVKRDLRFGLAQEGGTWYIERIPELMPIVL